MNSSNALRDLQSSYYRDRSYADYLALQNEFKARPPQLPEYRIIILRDFTIEPLLPVLIGEILGSGFSPKVEVLDFASIVAEAERYSHIIAKFEPNLIIAATWIEALSPKLWNRFIALSETARTSEIGRVQGFLRSVFQTIRNSSKAPIILNNATIPVAPTLGILDAQRPDSHTASIQELNRSFLELRNSISDVYLLDLLRLSHQIGFSRFFDARHWQIARAPLSNQANLALGQEYAKFIRALTGKNKKCLVLDCDNVLWGGVVGEVGLQGISLGTAFPGSAFRALQEQVLNLHDRGVIIALCSKNNERDVFEVLREHPEMLIREQHIAAWQINWDDKVTNLRRIAQSLNIGIDSLVFVDDSAFEANFVRQQLPEVTVVELAGDSSGFCSKLADGGWFDTLSYTAEDRQKNKMYAEDRSRKIIEDSSSSLEDYLSKLNVEISIGKDRTLDVPRIAQLTQKTNQFNLTTKRYSEGDIARFIQSQDYSVYTMRVRDLVSELGLVGVAILHYEGDKALIDSLLLSCRALGRGVEDAFLGHLISEIRKRDEIATVVARYVPTPKNAQVKNFYFKHGFTCSSENEQHSEWSFNLAGKTIEIPPWVGYARDA